MAILQGSGGMTSFSLPSDQVIGPNTGFQGLGLALEAQRKRELADAQAALQAQTNIQTNAQMQLAQQQAALAAGLQRQKQTGLAPGMAVAGIQRAPQTANTAVPSFMGDMVFPQRPQAPRQTAGPSLQDIQKQVEAQNKIAIEAAEREQRDRLAEIRERAKLEQQAAREAFQMQKQLQAQSEAAALQQIGLQKQPVREDVLLSLIGALR